MLKHALQSLMQKCRRANEMLTQLTLQAFQFLRNGCVVSRSCSVSKANRRALFERNVPWYSKGFGRFVLIQASI